MTSWEIDSATGYMRPRRCSFVKTNWRKQMEERRTKNIQEKIVQRIKVIEEEERIKSKSQDDIGEKSENPEKLFVHIKQQHKKDATKCALCGKELSSKSSLDRHLLIHAKWQPYRCNLCNKPFSTNGNMHRHKKTHKGVCKASKFVKEDSSKIKSVKRKRNVGETSENEQLVKKMNSGNENTKSLCGNNIRDIENKNVISDAKIYPLSPDSQPDVNQPSDDKTCHETVCNISSSPSKEEFITTLGLKTACRLDTLKELSGALNSQSDSSIHLQSYKDEYIAPKSSLSVDCEAKQQTSKDTVIELHPSQLLNLENLVKVSTVTSQIQIGPSGLHSKELAEVPKGNIDNNFNNMDGHWLPESPETSIEGNIFESLLNAEKLDQSKTDSLQPQYFCQHCKKEFKNKIIFQKHLIKHNKRKPFKCTICGAKLLSKQNATRHVVKVHNKRRMQAKLLIVQNLDDTPSTETKTLCEWCGQEFTSSLILEHHKRASTGCQAKPFICLICNKSFSTKNNGKRHQFIYHRNEQAKCCIVRNTMAKNNEDTNSQPRIMDISPSTSNIATVDVLQESSTESLLSSKSENPDDSELSLPNKELDAAQSLIDMFSSLPPHRSSDESIKDQPDISSSSSLQNNSSFYLPMPIPVNVQNKPLDLSVHPMDLSSKSNEQVKRFSVVDMFPFLVSREFNSDTRVFHVNKQSYIPSETPLDLVKKKEDNFFHLNSSLYQEEIDDMRQKESTSPKSPVSRECNICSMSFSTNSNKRRHDKTKHLMPFKLRLFSRDKQMTSTPKSVLSKKTKEALITKVSNLKSADFEPVDFSVNNDNQMIQPLAIISNESENGDLASVSSLINTANSPQLKKYLTADNACDVTENLDEAPVEVKEEQDLSKAVDQTLDSKKNKHWCAVCQKQFTCKSSFNRHSVIHTKKRDHHCQECEKTFTTKSNRDRHIKKVHRIILSSDSKKLLSSKKQQKKSIALVTSESSETEMDVSNLTLPKELVNSEISQCNKENQRLFMPS